MTSLTVAANLLWLRPGEVGGTEDYATRVLAAVLNHAGSELSVDAYAQSSVFEAHEPSLGTAACHSPRLEGLVWMGGGTTGRVVAERTWLRRELGTSKPDVIHHLGGTVPFGIDAPVVVTIHDLQPLDDPQNFSVAKRAWLARAIPAAVARADVIATPSDWVGDRLAERFAVERPRVLTVSAYAEPDATSDPSFARPEVLTRGPHMLYPAMTMAHKNHLMLFRAFSVAAETRPDLQLVCVGSKGRDDQRIRASAAALSPNIHMLGHVTSQTLGYLRSEAEAMVFPSLYEGFGLPILEAQQAGVPVVASTAGALPEVAGDGAVFCDPTDVDSWIDVMRSGLETSRRNELIATGRTNARRYSPESTAAAQIAAYRLASKT